VIKLKGFIKLVGAILVALVILVIGVYAALSIPKKVNTTWTQADVDSYEKKTGVNISSAGSSNTAGNSGGGNPPASLEDLLFNNFKSSGSANIDTVITASETTAMINTVTRSQSIFTDVRVGFRDDGTIEWSGNVGSNVTKLTNMFPEIKQYESLINQAVGKPIYWRCSVNRVSDKQFGGTTKELYVGQVPVPLDAASPGLIGVFPGWMALPVKT
jgi:hypothetical protein